MSCTQLYAQLAWSYKTPCIQTSQDQIIVYTLSNNRYKGTKKQVKHLSSSDHHTIINELIYLILCAINAGQFLLSWPKCETVKASATQHWLKLRMSKLSLCIAKCIRTITPFCITCYTEQVIVYSVTHDKCKMYGF